MNSCDAAAVALSGIGCCGSPSAAGLTVSTLPSIVTMISAPLPPLPPRISVAFSADSASMSLSFSARFFLHASRSSCVCGFSLATFSPLHAARRIRITIEVRVMSCSAVLLARSYYGLRVENSRALDELANDLSTDDVLDDHAFHFRPLHPIVQSRRAPRAGRGREARSERWRRFFGELANQHVGALRAATEAALPHQLHTRARVVLRERRSKDVVKLGRRAAIATLRAATDHDLEAPLHASGA